MKVNSAAMTRLIRHYIGGKHIAIPTNEHDTQSGRRIFLVPVKQILRAEQKYKDYKSITPFTPRTSRMVLDSPGNVNHIRHGIRRGDKIPPVSLRHATPNNIRSYSMQHLKKPHHHYILADGHHRLTAHQAEGKRFIRAVFYGDLPPAISIPKTSAGL